MTIKSTKIVASSMLPGTQYFPGSGGGGLPSIPLMEECQSKFEQLWADYAGIDFEDPEEDGLNASESTYDDASGWVIKSREKFEISKVSYLDILYFSTDWYFDGKSWVIAGVSGV